MLRVATQYVGSKRHLPPSPCAVFHPEARTEESVPYLRGPAVTTQKLSPSSLKSRLIAILT